MCNSIEKIIPEKATDLTISTKKTRYNVPLQFSSLNLNAVL